MFFFGGGTFSALAGTLIPPVFVHLCLLTILEAILEIGMWDLPRSTSSRLFCWWFCFCFRLHGAAAAACTAPRSGLPTQFCGLQLLCENRFRLTKLFYPAPSKQKTKSVMTLSRKQASLYVELITGQNNLNYIQSKMREISPECRFCEEVDVIFPHILNECPVFRQRRCDILLGEATTLSKWKVHAIIKFAYHVSILTALSFDQPHH